MRNIYTMGGTVLDVWEGERETEVAVRDAGGACFSVRLLNSKDVTVSPGDTIRWGGRLKAQWTNKDNTISNKQMTRCSWSYKLPDGQTITNGRKDNQEKGSSCLVTRASDTLRVSAS